MTPFWLPFGLKPRKDDAQQTRYADLYSRTLAGTIDALLLMVIFVLPKLGGTSLFDYLRYRIYRHIDAEKLAAVHEQTGSLAMLRTAWESNAPQMALLNMGVQLLLMGVFYVGCQWVYGSTPGKMLFGLSIRDADTLEPPAKWRLVLRYIAYVPGYLLFFVMSFNKRHRGVHDYLLGTVVIHTRPRGWYWNHAKQAFRWLRRKLRPVE